MTNFKAGVGYNIKLIRKSRNITQEDLAAIIGIHARQLSKIETGEHFPSCKTFEKICIALDVNPQELFNFEFLVDANEGVLTGTDNQAAFQVSASDTKNVYEIFPKHGKETKIKKTCTDESMAKTAKAMNKPVLVEYFDEKKTSKIVIYYPNGTEKVLRDNINVIAQQNMNFMIKEFKKIANDKAASEFIKLSLTALKNNDDLIKLENLIQGMKLARGL